MKNKFKNIIAFLAFLNLFIGNVRYIFASQVFENNKQIELKVDYLKKLPTSDYILGPGDLLTINVSRDYPELFSTVKIDREGTIYLPKINRIYVEGLTITEINKLLNIAFSEFVKYPSIEVSIINYRPIRIYIEGEVVNPGLQTLQGAFSINSEIDKDFDSESLNSRIDIIGGTNYFPTVFDAIRAAGGITRLSNLKEVEVIRIDNISSGGGRKKTILNFEEVIYEGEMSQNIRIYDGDTIQINKLDKNNIEQLAKATKSNLNPKFINIVVAGRVNNPGKIQLSKASTLNDAIDLAGGAKILKGKTRFLRFNNDGTIDNRKIKYSNSNKRGSYKNPYLREGDVVLVDNSLLTSTNEVLNEFTRPLTGIFSTYGLLKAISN